MFFVTPTVQPCDKSLCAHPTSPVSKTAPHGSRGIYLDSPWELKGLAFFQFSLHFIHFDIESFGAVRTREEPSYLDVLSQLPAKEMVYCIVG